ncbi:hypothetical protein, partial [Yaniella sp.]|uniref:hypothetical protein n=1 Tax=Yaniella sp. TaxID=2773929 RepID=UPI00264A45D6
QADLVSLEMVLGDPHGGEFATLWLLDPFEQPSDRAGLLCRSVTLVPVSNTVPLSRKKVAKQL